MLKMMVGTYGIGGMSWAEAWDIDRGSGAEAVASSLAVGRIAADDVFVRCDYRSSNSYLDRRSCVYFT